LSDLIGQTFQQFSRTNSRKKIVQSQTCGFALSSIFSLRQGNIKEDFMGALHSYIDFSWFSSYARFSTSNVKLTSNL